MIKEKLKQNLLKNKLDYDLRNGFLNLKSLNKVYKLRDGNINYIILYLKKEKVLKVWGNKGFYSCEILSISLDNLNKEVKQHILNLSLVVEK